MKEETDAESDEVSKPQRWRRWAVVVLLVVGGVWLASRQSLKSRAAQLRVGMSRQEVIAVMGEPGWVFMRGANAEVALFTELPPQLHAMLMVPRTVFARDPGDLETQFPASVEFERDIATRIVVEGFEIDAVRK